MVGRISGNGPAPDAGRKVSDGNDFGGGCGKPFINLSSIGAFVRQLFASNEAISGIRINKIPSDCMATNQKVGSSTLSGRTIKSITHRKTLWRN